MLLVFSCKIILKNAKRLVEMFIMHNCMIHKFKQLVTIVCYSKIVIWYYTLHFYLLFSNTIITRTFDMRSLRRFTIRDRMNPFALRSKRKILKINLRIHFKTFLYTLFPSWHLHIRRLRINSEWINLTNTWNMFRCSLQQCKFWTWRNYDMN